MRRRTTLLAFAAAAFAVIPATSSAAPEAEDDFYQPFNPDAAKLEFELPKPSLIEILNTRTMSREKISVDPFALQPSYGLEIYIFEIGQADAMLVVGPGPARKTLLVDLGISDEGRFKPDYSARHVGQRIAEITGRTRIDYFLLSHLHTDHFGSGDSGITSLMGHSDFSFGTVIDTGPLGAKWVKRSKSATEYLERVEKWVASGRIGEHVQPEFGTGQIDLGGGVRVDIVAFAGKSHSTDDGVHARFERSRPGFYRRNPASENDLSIALEISLGDFEFWTGGDLSGADGAGTAARASNYTNVEHPLFKAWQASGRESDVEIYRANHHGSRFSSSKDFLGLLDPELILISAEAGHGHPSAPMVVRGSGTAKMLATDIDPAWKKADFTKLGGEIVGEMRILVGKDGSGYSLNGTPYRSFSDAEERQGKDAQPAP